MQPQSKPIPSIPLKPRIFRPHKIHLSLKHIPADLTDLSMVWPLLKSLRVYKKLRIPSGITSLSIVSDKELSKQPSLKLLKRFYLRCLKQFRNLQSLKMTDISFKNFFVLKKAFRRFRDLRSLELTFDRVTLSSDTSCLRDFIKALSPRLKQLKLAFDEPIERSHDEDSRCHLKNCRIGRLNNLQKLSLSFPISSFLQEKKHLTGKPRYIDLSPMKRLNRLHSLNITLLHRSIEEEGQIKTKELYFDPNKLFPNLKKFTWSAFSSSDLRIKELEALGAQIASRLKDLDEFGLGFKHSRAKVEINELSQCLATLETYLNHLDFVYNCKKLSKQDAKALISALSSKRLNRLQTLSLEFSRCSGITNEFLADLAQVCAGNFLGLRSLRLSFEFDPSEKRDGKIFSCLAAIFGYEGVSDLGIKNLASILSKGCQDLEFVDLKFEEYSEISDLGVKSLCQRLNQLKKLKIVWIGFHDCCDVTEAGCQKAAKLLDAHRNVFVSSWDRSRICGCGCRY